MSLRQSLDSATQSFRTLADDNEAKGRTAVMLSRLHPRARSNLKLAERASRRLRLGRATLFLLARCDHGFPARVVAGFTLLERASPSLAEYLCPAILDYFYWRGARSELARVSASAGRTGIPERTRNASLRRADWRFCRPTRARRLQSASIPGFDAWPNLCPDVSFFRPRSRDPATWAYSSSPIRLSLSDGRRMLKGARTAMWNPVPYDWPVLT